MAKEQALPTLLLVPLAFLCWGPERAPALRRAAITATLPFLAAVAIFVGLYMLFGPATIQTAGDKPAYAVFAFSRTVCYYTLMLFAPTSRGMHTTSLAHLLRWDRGSF